MKRLFPKTINFLRNVKFNNQFKGLTQRQWMYTTPISAICAFSLLGSMAVIADDNKNNKKKNLNSTANRRKRRRYERESFNEKLCVAVKNKNYKFVSDLLSLDTESNPNARSKYGWCALHIAVVNDDHEMAQLLLTNGADVHIKDETNPLIGQVRHELFSNRIHLRAPTQGWTALHYAVAFGNESLIKLLISFGANPFDDHDDRGYCCADYLDETSPILDILETEYDAYLNVKSEIERKQRLTYPMEKKFKEKIVGQIVPIKAVTSAVRRKLNGWYDPEHSNLVFLFLGSSGVGKTELAKTLASILHSDKEHFIRIDMSEFQHKHEVAKFIGSPPGYVGHEMGGQLTDKLTKYPDAVVLFDEVEKAHPDVLTICLQLFDEGRITDGKGKTVDCKDAIFVMTSNLAQTEIGDYAQNLRKSVIGIDGEGDGGSGGEGEGDDDVLVSSSFIEQVIEPILKSHFQRDEFLGRINEILYFLPFNQVELGELTLKELNKWKGIAENEHNIELSWDDKCIDLLIDGYNFRYGARSIQHEVEKMVINQIADMHESGEIGKNSKIHISGNTEKHKIQVSIDNSNAQLMASKSDDYGEYIENINDRSTDNTQNKSWFW